jgi:phosphoribosyl 1,2-cyclic phosphodiesterase
MTNSCDIILLTFGSSGGIAAFGGKPSRSQNARQCIGCGLKMYNDLHDRAARPQSLALVNHSSPLRNQLQRRP